MFTPVASAPPDKALVYIYRKTYFAGSGGHYLILVNGHRIANLHNGCYYPYLASPGTNSFGNELLTMIGSQWATAMWLNDHSKDHMLQLNTEAGKTYYLQLKIANTWWPKIVQMDDETGAKEIARCSLGTALTPRP